MTCQVAQENSKPKSQESQPPPTSSKPQSAESLTKSEFNEYEAIDFIRDSGKLVHQFVKEELQELNKLRKKVMRHKLIAWAGTARKAFSTLDLNGSGSLSTQEFA